MKVAIISSALLFVVMGCQPTEESSALQTDPIKINANVDCDNFTTNVNKACLFGFEIDSSLISDHAHKKISEEAGNPWTIRMRLAVIRKESIAADSLFINLFEETKPLILFDSIDIIEDSLFGKYQIWSGSPDGHEGSISLSKDADYILGTVRVINDYYNIKPIENGIHLIIQFDLKKLPEPF